MDNINNNKNTFKKIMTGLALLIGFLLVGAFLLKKKATSTAIDKKEIQTTDKKGVVKTITQEQKVVIKKPLTPEIKKIGSEAKETAEKAAEAVKGAVKKTTEQVSSKASDTKQKIIAQFKQPISPTQPKTMRIIQAPTNNVEKVVVKNIEKAEEVKQNESEIAKKILEMRIQQQNVKKAQEIQKQAELKQANAQQEQQKAQILHDKATQEALVAKKHIQQANQAKEVANKHEEQAYNLQKTAEEKQTYARQEILSAIQKEQIAAKKHNEIAKNVCSTLDETNEVLKKIRSGNQITEQILKEPELKQVSKAPEPVVETKSTTQKHTKETVEKNTPKSSQKKIVVEKEQQEIDIDEDAFEEIMLNLKK